MKEITYSVVIPCFNCEKSIERALLSVYEQTFAPHQVICVNNNSTDATSQIIKNLQIKFNSLILVDETKQGASPTRNKGISIVDSDYIQFLDADDLLLPKKIESQLSLVDSNEPLPLIVGSYISKNNLDDTGRLIKPNYDKWIGLLRGQLGYTVANLWPTKWVQQLKGFNAELKTSEEYELLFRLLKENVSIIIAESALTIKINDNAHSLTKLNQSENWERFINLRMDIIQFLDSKGILNNSHYMAAFDAIRVGYNFNKKYSTQVYNVLLKNKFKIHVTETSSKKYALLFKIFGFPMADIIINKLK